MDSYLSIAAKVLREARRPLSAKQILEAAYKLQIVPSGLYGKTQHKTLHARLAEDILHRRSESMFVRTGPGRFFLRALLRDRGIAERYKKQYVAPLRAEQLKKFDVLSVDRKHLVRLRDAYGPIVPLSKAEPISANYISLRNAAATSGMCCLRVLVVLHSREQLLIRRCDVSLPDPFLSKASVGLLGYAKREDKTLFSQDKYGLREAAIRILSEQLHIESIFIQGDDLNRVNPIALVIDLDSSANENTMAAVVTCSITPHLERAISNSDNLYWHNMLNKLNDLSGFDPWSRELLSSKFFSESLAH